MTHLYRQTALYSHYAMQLCGKVPAVTSGLKTESMLSDIAESPIGSVVQVEHADRLESSKNQQVMSVDYTICHELVFDVRQGHKAAVGTE